LIVYLILAFKEWRNTIEKQKQNEQFAEKYEELKNQTIRSDFDPRNIPQLMNLINSEFQFNKWYSEEDLSGAIYKKIFRKLNRDFVKQIINDLAERDLIKMKEEYGNFSFMRK
ncbi:hypothetical protein, partial [Peribacillus sp. NPDC060253]|uniref:hypothetical protein n=1 Tax=Peribacillus sp. NPDC060253 TaxID=3347084 RepID=UPI003646E44D